VLLVVADVPDEAVALVECVDEVADGLLDEDDEEVAPVDEEDAVVPCGLVADEVLIEELLPWEEVEAAVVAELPDEVEDDDAAAAVLLDPTALDDEVDDAVVDEVVVVVEEVV